MRYFKIDNVIVLKGSNEEAVKLIGTELSFIPIIKNHYEVNNYFFKCIEHKKGAVTLKNDLYTIKLAEIYK